MSGILTIDIGNTHTHFALVESARDPHLAPQEFPTVRSTGEASAYATTLAPRLARADGIAYASVVPTANEPLETFLREEAPSLPVFQLTAPNVPPPVKISYPRPAEIGQDRLANAVAATALHPLPAVVIDLGTAVTFDIITAENGYEGGIIAPGVRVMTEFLHRQTALLPLLEEPLQAEEIIGTSTRQAMTIGCVIGFRGLIHALLEEIANELASRQTPLRSLIFTGGTGFLFRPGAEGLNFFRSDTVSSLKAASIEVDPAITLRGLYLASPLTSFAFSRD